MVIGTQRLKNNLKLIYNLETRINLDDLYFKQYKYTTLFIALCLHFGSKKTKCYKFAIEKDMVITLDSKLFKVHNRIADCRRMCGTIAILNEEENRVIVVDKSRLTDTISSYVQFTANLVNNIEWIMEGPPVNLITDERITIKSGWGEVLY